MSMSSAHDALVTLSNLSDADIVRMGVAALLRIANAVEARGGEEEVLEFPLSDFAALPWSTIGATIVQRDSDGVSIVRTANGRMAKRRSNDKFGTEVWFSYSDGKDDRGENRYVKVIVFRNVAPPEPLGRKTEQAVKAATPAATEPAKAGANTSPLMPHLLERYQALAKELDGMGDLLPADLTIGIDTTPPIAQGVLDKLARYVATKRDLHRTPADPSAPPAHSAPAGAGDGPLAAAKAWLADSGRRANADNMAAFAAELQRHMTACGCVLTTKEPNLNRKRDAFAAWILEQVPA